MQIAEDLEIDDHIKISHAESEYGFDYTAYLSKGKKGFDFWLDKKVNDSNEEMKASLSIDFEEGAVPFHFHENIDYIVGHSDYLSRWAAWAVFNFKQSHEAASLDSLFHETDIRIYGIPGYCDPAEGEAALLFHGIMAINEGNVLIYRFRHVDPPSGYLCRSFSYCVWVCPQDARHFGLYFQITVD